ncbi:MAG: hypothetical protein J0I57_03790 [Hyphomicrobium sp.]|uniref:hypothetical protein n=1 Tax=Hyphomicrobium sp. CS1BSMeth3 TaxID=1892844 RepID=UPI00093184C6|nr:hypothetical protein [Hyphomicrobium sp. CS1BSMeth3]MBN9267702.1 hypothetical protein [Hyphomicrobium sp.]MBN9276738.1 hypothetical protein [Hyphomicrobium sp.]
MIEFDFHANVSFIRDLGQLSSKPTGQYTMPLKVAVKRAITKHRPGETPAILGGGIELIGIDAIQAVFALQDFPRGYES